MDLGHSLVSQTSPLYQKYCWYVESVVFSATEIISNGRDRASDPQNWTAFFSFTIILHSFLWQLTRPMALTVCLSAFYVCLKHLWGRVGSTDGSFARKSALKWLASAVHRRESFEPRLSCKRTVCRPDPTSEYVCFCAEVFIVNWRADLRKYNKKLRYRRGTARCVVSVEILPIAKQQCRKYLDDKSWTNRSYKVGGLKWADA